MKAKNDRGLFTIMKTKFPDIFPVFYIPWSILYLELVMKAKASPENAAFWLPFFLFSLAFGVLLSAAIFVISDEKIRKITTSVILFVFSLYFTVEIFVESAYQVFMTVESISQGTGGVLTDFFDTFLKAIKNGFWTILLLFFPFFLFLVLCLVKKLNFHFGQDIAFRWNYYVPAAVASVLIFSLSSGICHSNDTFLDVYQRAYNFDNATRSFGLLTASRLDIQYSLFGNPSAGDFVIDEPVVDPEIVIPSTEEPNEPSAEEPEPPKEYGYNILDIDFDALIADTKDSTLQNVHRYVASLPGTKQNEYTGLFKGKNLILIAAESFSKEVIDENLTPTLYRLYKNGITLTDFYQPTWGGSTSTGEYAILTGFVPTAGVSSIRKVADYDLRFTIGNELRKEGYFSAAYHNGTYTYYSRDLTHTKLGYDTFLAFGNGLEKREIDGTLWPPSDLELFQCTMSDYMEHQPFSVYYMTVSGHGYYTNFAQAMSQKNKEEVKDLPYSAMVRSYLSANLELEHALTYLIDELEKAGIADDTVICLCPDHYPYALEKGESWGNNEDYLGELYGYHVTNNAQRDHSVWLLWSGCLENEHADLSITINEPTYSLDILPTLCNLFGVEYDSRLLVGRDIFSDTDALVVWPEYNWKTTAGYYNYTKKEFIPTDPSINVSKAYIDSINAMVKNKITYSKAFLNYDYFHILFGDSQ